MERQKSYSIKPSSLLLFSITIFSSLLIFILFYSWVLTSPSTQPQLELTASATSTSNASSSTAPAILIGLAQNPILRQTHLRNHSISSPTVAGSEKDGKDSILGGNSSLIEDTLSPSVEQSSNNAAVETSFEREEDVSEAVSESIDEKFEVKSGVRNESYGGFSVNSLASAVTEAVVDERKGPTNCDLSNGRWVFDENLPLYTSSSCPYVDEGFSCESNGRLDRDYMKWRWQPYGCEIPRFDPVRMLHLLRGKRLVFVGDSINRNQWESMLCMLRGAVRDPFRVIEARGRKITKEIGNYNFKFLDYGCSVEFYVSHFLVHESKARVGKRRVKTLRIDAIDRGSSRWKGADILIFNTAHWWSHYKTKSGVNYYQEGDHVHPHLDVSTAFQKALMTWAAWVDQHVNPRRAHVFFRSSSPSHFGGGEWNSGGHCLESKQPLNDTISRGNPQKNLIVEDIIRQMKTRVTFLNITTLSGLRIDGHPSIYGRKPGGGNLHLIFKIVVTGAYLVFLILGMNYYIFICYQSLTQFLQIDRNSMILIFLRQLLTVYRPCSHFRR